MTTQTGRRRQTKKFGLQAVRDAALLAALVLCVASVRIADGTTASESAVPDDSKPEAVEHSTPLEMPTPLLAGLESDVEKILPPSRETDEASIDALKQVLAAIDRELDYRTRAQSPRLKVDAPTPMKRFGLDELHLHIERMQLDHERQSRSCSGELQASNCETPTDPACSS